MIDRSHETRDWWDREFRGRDGRIALKPIHVAFLVGFVLGAIIF